MNRRVKVQILLEYDGFEMDKKHCNNIPDYYNDLNAIRQLEHKLSNEGFTVSYVRNLMLICKIGEYELRDDSTYAVYVLLHATAEEKADALVMTLVDLKGRESILKEYNNKI